jgi:hypothetical protein
MILSYHRTLCSKSMMVLTIAKKRVHGKKEQIKNNRDSGGRQMHVLDPSVRPALVSLERDRRPAAIGTTTIPDSFTWARLADFSDWVRTTALCVIRLLHLAEPLPAGHGVDRHDSHLAARPCKPIGLYLRSSAVPYLPIPSGLGLISGICDRPHVRRESPRLHVFAWPSRPSPLDIGSFARTRTSRSIAPGRSAARPSAIRPPRLVPSAVVHPVFPAGHGVLCSQSRLPPPVQRAWLTRPVGPGRKARLQPMACPLESSGSFRP